MRNSLNRAKRPSTSTCGDHTICGRRNGDFARRTGIGLKRWGNGSGIPRSTEISPYDPGRDREFRGHSSAGVRDAKGRGYSSLDSALVLSDWKLSNATVRSEISLEIASVNNAVEVPFSPSPK